MPRKTNPHKASPEAELPPAIAADLGLRERLQVALAGRYNVQREIGRGGMATVYLAEDPKLQRAVAMKVLLPELAAAIGHERFLREVMMAARLQHPHILGVHDSGDAGGFIYYTMPFVAGETLRERLDREGELPVGEAIWVLRDVLDALAYAHQHGVVHRDIKPDNIILSGRHAFVMDFGVAKAVSQAGVVNDITISGVAVGTPAYMAPEQASGSPQIDHRADIYSAGVLAYELLTGQPPFTGSTAQEVLAAHVTKAATPVTARRPSIPLALAQTVMRCLEKRPADRWQSAGEFLARLEGIETSGSISVPGISLYHEPVDQVFRLTEAVCRRLNRATLDPRAIGDQIHYLDNQVESDVLVFYLHGLGLDQRDWEDILRRSNYRGIAPTFYGFDPQARRRIGLPIADHATVVRELIRQMVERLGPAVVVLVGFSSGADVAFRVAAPPADEPPLRLDAMVTLDCNLTLDTCFASRVIARFSPGDPDTLLSDLRSLGAGASSLTEWLNMHEYLVKILRKFGEDVTALRNFAHDVVEPFEARGLDAFVEWYRDAAAPRRVLRCVFSDLPVFNAALDRIRLENLDRGMLGPNYRENSLLTEPETDHFDLMAPDRIIRLVDEVVEAVLRGG